MVYVTMVQPTWVGGDPNCNHMRDSKVNPSNCITGHKNHDKMAELGMQYTKLFALSVVRSDKIIK